METKTKNQQSSGGFILTHTQMNYWSADPWKVNASVGGNTGFLVAPSYANESERRLLCKMACQALCFAPKNVRPIRIQVSYENEVEPLGCLKLMDAVTIDAAKPSEPCFPPLVSQWFSQLIIFRPLHKRLWSNINTQNGTLVNGNMHQGLRSVSWWLNIDP